MKKETEACDREYEPDLKNEFIKKINETEKQKSIEVDDFSKRYSV